MFVENGYGPQDINWAMNRIHGSKKTGSPHDRKGCVLVPYYGAISSKIQRLIGKFHFIPLFVPLVKLRQLLCSAKYDLALQVTGDIKSPAHVGRCILGRLGIPSWDVVLSTPDISD